MGDAKQKYYIVELDAEKEKITLTLSKTGKKKKHK